jgi:hypothetical protein
MIVRMAKRSEAREGEPTGGFDDRDGGTGWCLQ